MKFSSFVLLILLVNSIISQRYYLVASNRAQINSLIKGNFTKRYFRLNFNTGRITYRICNVISGDFVKNGDNMTFSNWITTLMLCFGSRQQLENKIKNFFQHQPIKYKKLYNGNMIRLRNQNNVKLWFAERRTVEPNDNNQNPWPGFQNNLPLRANN